MLITAARLLANMDLIATDCDAGTTPQLIIYDGAVPATPETALGAQVALSTHDYTTGLVFQAASGGTPTGTLTGNLPDDDISATAGTPSFGRIIDGNGVVRIQGTAGTSGTDFIVSASPFVAAQTISVTAVSITQTV